MKPTSSFVRQIGFTLLLSALVLRPSTSSAQGPLNPPGPPAPGMKSLDQIEPRTNLQANPAPAGVDTTNTDYHFIINQSGSYYLSANLSVSKTHGIQINVPGVTLALNGFQVARGHTSGGHGLEIVPTAHRTTVQNGTIRGFAYGIRSMQGGSDFANACAFRELAVSGCTEIAIYAGEGAVLESCRVHGNTGSSGIFTIYGSSLTNCTASNNTLTNAAIRAGSGSTLSNCLAYRNTATYGIYAGTASTLINCTALSNTVDYGIFTFGSSALTNCATTYNVSSATHSAGIRTDGQSTISHCTSNGNLSSVAPTPTTGMGFWLGPHSTIQGCTASANHGDGIRIYNGTLARDNTSTGNGNEGDGAGIHAGSSDNRIEGNNVSFNNRGIDVAVGRNVIIRNTASQNTTNYALAANNVFGAIVNRTAPASAAVNGNSAASSAGTTDPWANFSY